jgi:hypothetical protein
MLYQRESGFIDIVIEPQFKDYSFGHGERCQREPIAAYGQNLRHISLLQKAYRPHHAAQSCIFGQGDY